MNDDVPRPQPAERTAPAAPRFDPDFSPSYPTNREAAAARGLRYDPARGAYVDEDGCLIRDRFGQRM